MAAPNPADQPPASAPAGHDQGAALNQDPTGHLTLTELFAGTHLGVPMDAPDHI